MRPRIAFALVTVQVVFGLLPVASKVAFEHLGPLPLTALRVGLATVLLLLLHRFVATSTVPVSLAPKLAMLALFGVVINQGLFILGLRWTTAVHATLLITTIPVFTYTLAVLLGKEQLGPRRALGIGLAFAGIVYLISTGGLELGLKTALGDLMVLGNSLSYAAFLVLSKPVTEKYDPFSVTTAVFLFATVFFVPVGIATGLVDQVQSVPALTWWVVAYIVVGPTVLAYVLNNTALRDVPASTVAVFIYLQPIIAATSAAWVLGEEVSWRIVPAAVLVFWGVYLVARKRKVVTAEPVAA